MALRFGAVNSNRVDLGSAAGIDDTTEFSLALALNMSVLGNNNVLCAKHDAANTGWFLRLTGTTGNVVFVWNRATTNLIYATDSTPLATTGAWWFLGVTMSQSGNVVTMYSGSLFGDTLTTNTFGTLLQPGSGPYSSDAAQTLQIGNRGADTASLQADVALFARFPRILTKAEFESFLCSPRVSVTSGRSQIFMPLGMTGTGTQLDRSGNANNGTVSGPTQVAGPAWGLWHRGLLAA